jgi:hypothetical protein
MPRKKAAEKSENKVENCRIVTELLDTNGDAIQSWRVFRIMSEFVEGFDLLRKHGLAVSIFGSARMRPGDPWYKEAENLAAKLAKKGFAVITGGGPGIMEASNVGAFKVGGKSIGLNIELPHEQSLNPYTTESENFHFFFSRKVMLSLPRKCTFIFPVVLAPWTNFSNWLRLFRLKKLNQSPLFSSVKIFGSHS